MGSRFNHGNNLHLSSSLSSSTVSKSTNKVFSSDSYNNEDNKVEDLLNSDSYPSPFSWNELFLPFSFSIIGVVLVVTICVIINKFLDKNHKNQKIDDNTNFKLLPIMEKKNFYQGYQINENDDQLLSQTVLNPQIIPINENFYDKLQQSDRISINYSTNSHKHELTSQISPPIPASLPTPPLQSPIIHSQQQLNNNKTVRNHKNNDIDSSPIIATSCCSIVQVPITLPISSLTSTNISTKDFLNDIGTNFEPSDMQVKHQQPFSPKYLVTNSNTATEANDSPYSINHNCNIEFGNYFRFPDVDIFSPPIVTQNARALSLSTNIRKGQLKSISLDSEMHPTDCYAVIPTETKDDLNIMCPPPSRLISQSSHTPLLNKSLSSTLEYFNKMNLTSGIKEKSFSLEYNNLEDDFSKNAMNNKDDNDEQTVLNENDSQCNYLQKQPKTPLLKENSIAFDIYSEYEDSNSVPKNNFVSKCNSSDNKTRNLNINNLKISLNNTIISNSSNNNNLNSYETTNIPSPKTPKTPILKKKAISLDNADTTLATKLQPSDKFNISVPNTPMSHHLKHNCNKKLVKLNNHSPSSYNMMPSPSSTSNLQVLKTSTLSLSNNNLKTLPEIMPLSDFNNQTTQHNKPSNINNDKMVSNCSKSQSILQRRGSNHSLTLNLNEPFCTLTKVFSNSNNNIINSNSKRNLLQRRGSNTSLTLNLKNNSNISLNRFNSHSSLNIPSTTKEYSKNYKHQYNNLGNNSNTLNTTNNKRGLLERRNSNASLTLNINLMSRSGLSISNNKLNDSNASSLNSINNEDNMLDDKNENNQHLSCHVTERLQSSLNHQQLLIKNQRKFFSSENINNANLLSNLNQTSITNKKYNSIDNLETSLNTNKNNTTNNQLIDCDKILDNSLIITTKPLSPQSTSEDFKIYLANIQYLQNSTNQLNDVKLKNLNKMFNKTYSSTYYQDQAIGSSDQLLITNLHEEFWELPTNYQEKPIVFGSQSKNRYKTILPNEHSRVILNAETGSTTTPYINANYIKGPDYTTNLFIATQGPMQNTIYDFWLMVHQNVMKHKISHNHNGTNHFKRESTEINEATADFQQPKAFEAQKIIMLTNFVENNSQKCAVYFPQKSEEYIIVEKSNTITSNTTTPTRIPSSSIPSTHTASSIKLLKDNLLNIKEFNKSIKQNYFIIRNVKLIKKIGYEIRELLVIYYDHICTKNFDEYNVYHYWYPDWPDHKSPENLDILIDLSLDFLNNYNPTANETSRNLNSLVKLEYTQMNTPLPIIHCSAGIGRTGCFAAILNGIKQIYSSISLNNSINLNNINVDVLGIVCNLRLQRGGMVQNSEQYELIHRALCLYQDRLLKIHVK